MLYIRNSARVQGPRSPGLKRYPAGVAGRQKPAFKLRLALSITIRDATSTRSAEYFFLFFSLKNVF
jgi:hypothetical protein